MRAITGTHIASPPTDVPMVPPAENYNLSQTLQQIVTSPNESAILRMLNKLYDWLTVNVDRTVIPKTELNDIAISAIKEETDSQNKPDVRRSLVDVKREYIVIPDPAPEVVKMESDDIPPTTRATVNMRAYYVVRRR